MFRFSCSSSLLGGCDEPEILRYENLKSVPQALTSDNILETGNDSYRFKASSEAAKKTTKENATLTKA